MFALFILGSLFAQKPPSKNTIDLSGRPGDHLMLQYSTDWWLSSPDSIRSRNKGFSRGANVYIMLDKPFKTNQRLSFAFGVGIGTTHQFFENLSADITGTTAKLEFNDLDTVNRFKKYKISNTFAEIPVELRYTANPLNPNKSFKAAIGFKVGTLINAHTKGKTLQDRNGQTIKEYIEKLTCKNYFSNTRLAATARIGYGYFTVFGAYNLTAIFKNNVAADMKLLQVGLTVSGL